MLRKLWAMIRKELRIASQQPAQWALIMLTPLAFVAVMGSVFGGGGSPDVAVYFVREDEGRLARQVEDAILDVETLDAERLATRAEADAAVGAGRRMAAVVIPAGFSAAALTGCFGLPFSTGTVSFISAHTAFDTVMAAPL